MYREREREIERFLYLLVYKVSFTNKMCVCTDATLASGRACAMSFISYSPNDG